MFKLFKNFNKRDLWYVFICLVLIVFQVWIELKMPDYMSSITRLVQTEGSTMSDILLQGMYMLLCALGSLISAICVGFLTSKLSAHFSLNLRKNILIFR